MIIHRLLLRDEHSRFEADYETFYRGRDLSEIYHFTTTYYIHISYGTSKRPGLRSKTAEIQSRTVNIKIYIADHL